MPSKLPAFSRLLLLFAMTLAGARVHADVVLPVVHVTTDITSNLTSIQVGQTATINVRAVIENPASAHDGIFSFDQDMILANILPNKPSVLSVQSVTRPGADAFVGSNGTVDSNGVHSIYGGYLSDTVGITTPALLFSIVVKGIALGTDQITPGPSTDPLGFDFVLYESTTAIGVTYDNGVLLQVVAGPGGGQGGGGGGGSAVPLPLGALAGLATAVVAIPSVRRRRVNR